MLPGPMVVDNEVPSDGSPSLSPVSPASFSSNGISSGDEGDERIDSVVRVIDGQEDVAGLGDDDVGMGIDGSDDEFMRDTGNLNPIRQKEEQTHNILPEFELYIMYRQHPTKPVRYEVMPDVDLSHTTVGAVKKHLAACWNVPVDVQVLKSAASGAELPDEMTLAAAGISSTESFLELDSAKSFTVSVEEDQAEEEAARIKAEHKQVLAILGAESDADDVESSTTKTIGCGLKNQGATCYLNSLLQSLYMTPQFRRMMYRFPTDFDALMNPKKKKSSEGGSKSKDKKSGGGGGGDLSASGQVILGGDLNAGEAAAESDTAEKNAIYQFQCLFARMQCANVRAVSTSGLTKSFGWDNNEVFVQHDVQELNRVLIDKLEEKMKLNEEDTEFTLRKMYMGQTLYTMQCLTCKRLKGRVEDYYDLTLTIKEFGATRAHESIMDCFKQMTSKEVMDGDNMVNCSRCGTKEPAERGTRFKSFPDVLTLHMNRYEYDFQRDTRVKIEDDVDFPDTLDLSPYLAQEGTHSQLDNSDDESAAPPKPEYADNKRPVFELYAALVHAGSAGFGHYYAYIKSFDDGKWYKYNDESVTLSSVDDVHGRARPSAYGSNYSSRYSSSSMYRSSATPYMLIYRRVPEATGPLVNSKHEDSSVEPPVSEPVGSDAESDSGADASDREMGDDAIGKSDDAGEMEIEPDEHGMRSTGYDFIIPPIADSEIPAPILTKLAEERELRRQTEELRAREQATVALNIYRNRLDLPRKKMRVPRDTTLQATLDAVIDLVRGESSKPLFYRFRRVAKRKNETFRPAEHYPLEKYQQTLEEVGITERKSDLYLEQHEDPAFPGLSVESNDQIFVQIRLWDETHPTTIGDFVLPGSMTQREVKDLAARQLGVSPDDVLLVEEETEELINRFEDPDKSLKSSGIITGDVLHVEPLDRDFHLDDKGRFVRSKVQEYFAEQRNRVVCDVAETKDSLRERLRLVRERQDVQKQLEDGGLTATEPMTDAPQLSLFRWLDKGGDDTTYTLRLETNLKHTLHNLRVVLAFILNLDSPFKLRVYARDFISRYDDGKLLKDDFGRLEQLLKRRSSRNLLKSIQFVLLQEEEHLKRGDRLIKTKLYTGTKEYHSSPTLCVNKFAKLYDLKVAMQAITQVPPERCILSEWYQEYFYRVFDDDQKLVRDCRLKRSDVVRADELAHEDLNVGKRYGSGTRLPVQIVMFMKWTTGYGGRKEVETDYPCLGTFDNLLSVFDFRVAVAERVGVPYWNLDLGLTGTFPIQKQYLENLSSWTKRFQPAEGKNSLMEFGEFFKIRSPAEEKLDDKEAPVNEVTVGNSPAAEGVSEAPLGTDVDDAWAAKLEEWSKMAQTEEELAIFKAYHENRDHVTFDFRAEKRVSMKSLSLRDLFIVLWEDLRTDKPESISERRTTGRGSARRAEAAISIKI